MKNRKNDRSDASLQVDHLGDVSWFPVWSPSSHRGGFHKNVYISVRSGSLIGDINTQSVI